MSPTTATPRCGAKKQDKSREEVVVALAFDSIFELYPDQDALAKALDEAKGKFQTLKSQKEELSRHIMSLKEGWTAVKKELSGLQDILDTIVAVQADEEFQSEELSTKAFIEETIVDVINAESVSLQQMKGRLKQALAEMEKARAFVKMLEGANEVAATCGMKRRSHDFVENKAEEPRPARRKTVERRPTSDDEASRHPSEHGDDGEGGVADGDEQDDEYVCKSD